MSKNEDVILSPREELEMQVEQQLAEQLFKLMPNSYSGMMYVTVLLMMKTAERIAAVAPGETPEDVLEKLKASASYICSEHDDMSKLDKAFKDDGK